MIPIDRNKLQVTGCEVESLQDGSVRIIYYTKPLIPKDPVQLRPQSGGYGRTMNYILTIDLPAQRKAVTIVTVAHTSANCWQVSYSTPTGADICSVHTLTEVNALLLHIFK